MSADENSERSNISSWTIIVAFLAVLCLPFALIGLAILEHSTFGTAYVGNVYRTLGIYQPLESLYNLIVWCVKK
jgi:hypothetical protein